MAFQKTDLQTPGPDQVIFYTGENYTGDAYLANIGDAVDLYRNYPDQHDKLKSVKIGSASKILLYQDDDFHGKERELIADTSPLAVGGMSSFKVLQKENVGECPKESSEQDLLKECKEAREKAEKELRGLQDLKDLKDCKDAKEKAERDLKDLRECKEAREKAEKELKDFKEKTYLSS